MKEYGFEDIEIGTKENFETTITKEKQEMFCHLSGDCNPMHCDRGFAKSSGFDDVVVYGMLTASFFSTLVGMFLPGKYALFQGMEKVMFHNPVYIDEPLEVEGTVIEKDERFSRIVIKAVIRGREKKKVCSARLLVGVLKN